MKSVSRRLLVGALTTGVVVSGAVTGAARAAGPDTTKPTVTSVTMSTTSVDTTGHDAQFTVTVQSSDPDDSSGLYGFVTFTSPSGQQSVYPSFNGSTGTANVTIPQWSENGTWLMEVVVRDPAGNTVDLDGSALAAVITNPQKSLTVTGPADVTAPTVSPGALSFTPASPIDSTNGAVPLTVHLQAQDSQSGVHKATVTLTSPTGRTLSTNLFASPVSTNVTMTSNDLVIPQYLVPADNGSWLVSLTIDDAMGNRLSLDNSQVSAAGLQSTLTINARTDQTPPTVASLAFAPSNVDATSAAQQVGVTARIDDAGAGVDAGNLAITLTSPQGSVLYGIFGRDTSAGAPADQYTTTLTVPLHADNGRWAVTSLSVADLAGNTKSYAVADLTATQNGINVVGTHSTAFSAVKGSVAQVTYGNSATVSGVLLDTTSGGGAAGRTVTLLSRPSATSPWGALATRVTSSTGAVAAVVKPGRNTQYSWRFAGEGADNAAPASSVVTIKVAPVVSSKLSATRVPHGRSVTLTGKVGPNRHGRVVVLQRRSGRRWVTVTTQHLSATSSYKFTIKTVRPGTSVLRVVRPAESAFAAAASKAWTLRVT